MSIEVIFPDGTTTRERFKEIPEKGDLVKMKGQWYIIRRRLFIPDRWATTPIPLSAIWLEKAGKIELPPDY